MTAALKLFRALLPYLVAIAVVFGALFAAYRHGVNTDAHRSDAVIAQRDLVISGLKLQHATELAKIDSENRKALADAQQAVIDAQQKGAADMAALDLKYTKELQNEKAKSVRDIAAVRSGAWRVRDEFTCKGTSGATGTPGTGTSVDTGTRTGGLRPEDAAEIVSESDRADEVVRQLSACQAIITRDRAAQ